jgi:hypothetical protein
MINDSMINGQVFAAAVIAILSNRNLFLLPALVKMFDIPVSQIVAGADEIGKQK